MIEIPVGIAPELVPLSWLIGTWEGLGVISYDRSTSDEPELQDPVEFSQRVVFADDHGEALAYTATVTNAETGDLITTERGYWRLALPREAGDIGPGLVPATSASVARSTEDIEKLRDAAGFPINVTLTHPDGVAEIYAGHINGPRIDIATESVISPQGGAPYEAASRMFGLVNGKLMWAWDIAAHNLTMRSHASAVLDKVAVSTDGDIGNPASAEHSADAPTETDLPTTDVASTATDNTAVTSTPEADD